MSDPYAFTHVTRDQDGVILVHAESRSVEAHYEITAENAQLLADSLGVPLDQIPDGWRDRVAVAGPSATIAWLDDHGIPFTTAFAWMDMDD